MKRDKPLKKITEKLRDTILKDYRNGLKRGTIAIKNGVSYKTVTTVLESGLRRVYNGVIQLIEVTR